MVIYKHGKTNEEYMEALKMYILGEHYDPYFGFDFDQPDYDEDYETPDVDYPEEEEE